MLTIVRLLRIPAILRILEIVIPVTILTKQSQAKQMKSKAKPSKVKAKQSEAKQSKAKQRQAKQS